MDPIDPFPDESLELLKRARAGDQRALSDLLERFRERLLGRIRLMMGADARGEAESLDFLQGTLLQALRNMERFEVRDERAFLRWLTTIAKNRIADSSRRRRESAFEAFSESCSIHRDGDARTPSTEASRRERHMELVEALEELAPEARRIVELKSLDGMTFREAGEQLGLTEDQARHMHRRALLELGRRMTPDPD